MNPACKKSRSNNAPPLTQSNAAPAPENQISVSEGASLPTRAEHAPPPVLEVVAGELSASPAELAEERVGKVEEETPTKELRWALLGAASTVVLITLAQILSDLIRAIPAYNTLRRWCGEMELSSLLETIRVIGRSLVEFIKTLS